MFKYLSPLVFLLLAIPSHAQTPNTVRICNGTQPNCPLVGSANPLPVTSTPTPGTTQDINVKQWNGSAVGAPSAYGTSPGAVTVPGVNAYITNSPTVAPVGKTTTQAKVTVSVTNTYQQALASSAARTGCTIQYVSVAGSKGYVFFGSSPADTTTSFQLTNGQSINCAVGGVAVATDAVQVTATATDIFVVSNQ